MLRSCVHGMRVWDDETGVVSSRCGFPQCDDGLGTSVFDRIEAAASLPMHEAAPKAPSSQVAHVVPVPTTSTIDLRVPRPFNPRVNAVSRNENPSFTVTASPPPKRPPTPVERLRAARPDWFA